MEFTKEDLKKIEKDQVFLKNGWWIKPIYNQQNYPAGSLRMHYKFFKTLKKFLGSHIPPTKLRKFSINNQKVLLIIQKNVEGFKIESKPGKGTTLIIVIKGKV